MHGVLLLLTFILYNEQIRINNDIKYFKKIGKEDINDPMV